MNTHTLPSNIRLTGHAIAQMRRRGIKSEQLAYCLAHGKQRRARDGAVTYTLRSQDIQPEDYSRMERSAGLIAIMEAGTTRIITVYNGNHHSQKPMSRRMTSQAAWRQLKAVA